MQWTRNLFKVGYHFSADYEQLEGMTKKELIEYRNMLDEFQKFHEKYMLIRESFRIEIQTEFVSKDLLNLWMNPHLISDAKGMLNSEIVKRVKIEMEKTRVQK